MIIQANSMFALAGEALMEAGKCLDVYASAPC